MRLVEMCRQALLVALILMAACGTTPDPGGLAPALQTHSANEGQLRATYATSMTHTITGDFDFSYDGIGVIDVTEQLGGAFPDGASLLTASVGQGGIMNATKGGSNEPASENDTLLRWSADLVPGLYKGPGTYEIEKKTAPALGPQSGIRSGAYLTVVGPHSDPGKVMITFNVLVEPCTLTYSEAAATGKVVCPQLGLESEPTRTISWTWEWHRLTQEEFEPDRDFWERFLPIEPSLPVPSVS